MVTVDLIVNRFSSDLWQQRICQIDEQVKIGNTEQIVVHSASLPISLTRVVNRPRSLGVGLQKPLAVVTESH